MVSPIQCCDTARKLNRESISINEVLFDLASAKELKGDLDGALCDFEQVRVTDGAYPAAQKGIEGIQTKLQLALVQPLASLAGNMDQVAGLSSSDPTATTAVPANNKPTNKCSGCQRTGIALSKSTACKNEGYCSKACQVSACKKLHKYVCTGSKSYLGEVAKVQLNDLTEQTETQYNGAMATIQCCGRGTIPCRDPAY